MKSNPKHGTSDTGLPGQSRVAGPGKAGSKIVRGKDTSNRESAIIDDEADTLSRKQSVATRDDVATSREDAATSREGAATLREGAATSREGAATSREGAATSREGAATSREDAATSREDAATSREDAADHREDAATSREDAATSREDAATSREDAATSREDAADHREDAADHREGHATKREHQIRATDMIHEAAETHMTMLQQVNERLVTVTMESKQLSEQLRVTATQLESTKLAAEKANLAKSAFLSSMSHELRSPLNAILGFAQLLETGNPPLTDTQEERLHQITKAGWYLLELINEILDLAMIESGKLLLSQQSVLLNDVMLECQEMIAPIADQRDIHIRFPRFELPYHVYGDRTRLKQVLINLLSNAVKYNREHGSVTLNYTTTTPGRIRLSITDTGKGLSPDQLAQLFQPFNRLGQEASSVEGTGIGLVVSKQLVELMGGEIGAISTEGVGSEFWIEMMQVNVSQIDEKMTRPEKVAPQVTEKWQAHTLLYVEDNPANLLLVEHIIRDHPSLRMLSANNGSLGVALARAHLPEVILMDIGLPDMSGIEAMNILRKEPATAHIPVIAVTANAMPHDLELGLKAGFFRYITKPINVNQLMNALDDALKSLE